MPTYDEVAGVSVSARRVVIHDHRTSIRAALAQQVKSANPTIEIIFTDDSFTLADRFVAVAPAVVLIGIRGGDASGMQALDLLMSLHPNAPIVVFGVASDSALLAAAVAHGARGVMLCEVAEHDPPTDTPPGRRTGAGFRADPADLPSLTVREDQVLRGMSQGKSNGQIGRELYLSEDTIKTHARRLFNKLGALDRAHAVALALRHGHLD